MAFSVIDCHHHLDPEPGYVDKLLRTADELQLEQIVLIAPMLEGGNAILEEEIKRHGDRLRGFAVFDWQHDGPETVIQYRERGFTGLKFIKPPADYRDRRWFPVYRQAERLHMPGLFHLGIVSRRPGREEVDCSMMRPVYLDTIARAFPDWRMIGAHLGNPWYEEAAMACRWNPNLYFDLSGSTLKCKPARFLGDLLWWTPFTRYRDPEGRYAWEKIVFGSDVPYFEIRDVLNDYERLLDDLQIAMELRRKVFADTARSILGLA
ncbi:MAG: amidohydrolase family protein [Bacteroidota bacterium]